MKRNTFIGILLTLLFLVNSKANPISMFNEATKEYLVAVQNLREKIATLKSCQTDILNQELNKFEFKAVPLFREFNNKQQEQDKILLEMQEVVIKTENPNLLSKTQKKQLANQVKILNERNEKNRKEMSSIILSSIADLKQHTNDINSLIKEISEIND